jgi:hypothetical protein
MPALEFIARCQDCCATSFLTRVAQECVVNTRIPWVLRPRPFEIKEVAIQVNIVFGLPTPPRTAPGVDQMNQQHSDLPWQFLWAAAHEPVALASRACQALQAVSSGYEHEQCRR